MSKKFLKGTMLGALVGAVGGLLLAPRKGKEARAQLKKQAKEYKNDTEAKATYTNKTLQKLSKGFKKETTRYGQRLKQLLHQVTEAPKTNKRKVKK